MAGIAVAPARQITPQVARPTSTPWLFIALVAVWVGALAAIILGAAHRMPRPDEGHFSSPAFNLSHFGFPGTTTVDPQATGLLRIDQRTYWTMPLYMVVEAAWFLIFPATLFSARMLTIILLIPVGWQLYRIVDALTHDKRTAMLAATLLPVDYAFMYAAVSARPDVLCLLLGLSALASYLKWRSRNLNNALVISSFWLALSALTHPNALLHLAALLLLIVVFDRRRLSFAGLVSSAAVYLAVFLPWLIYIQVDFQAFLAQMGANGTNNGRIAGTINPVQLLTAEFSRYASAYGLESHQLIPKLKSLTLVLYVAAVVLAFRLRKQRGFGILLLLGATYLAVQTVFNQKLSVYLIHILPVYSALLASVTVYIWQTTVRARPFVVLMLVGSVALQCGGMFWTSRVHSEVSQAQVASFLRTNAASANTINGSSTLVYATGFDRRLAEDHSLGLTTGKHPDVIVTDQDYADSFTTMAQKRPALFADVKTRLMQYPVVFRNSDFTVRFSPEYCRNQTVSRCGGSAQ